MEMVWVEIPRGLSEEIETGLKESKDLPKSTIQEQKDILKQQEQKVSAMPEPIKKGLKEKPKPEKKLTPAEKKMRDAIAKIDQNLKNRVIQPEAAQVGSSGEGYKYGTSDKPLRVPIDDPEYVKYQSMVRFKIIQEWIVPMKYEESRPQARIIVMIAENGEIISTEWDTHSGDTSFDASCIRAIKRASPVDAPPERLKWEAYNEGFLIDFYPR